jgi:hypothetical protein
LTGTPEYSPIIKKKSLKKSQTFKTLFEVVRHEFSGRIADKTFIENVIGLIKTKDLQVIGFDSSTLPEGKRHQTQKELINGLILRGGKSTITPLDVQMDIAELDNSDIIHYKEKEEKIKIRFKDKYDEYLKQKEDFYNSLIPRVTYTSAKTEYEKHIQQINEDAQRLYEANKYQLQDMVHSKAKPGKEWRGIIPSIKKNGEKLQIEVDEPVTRIIRTLKEYHREWVRTGMLLRSSALTKKSKIWEVPDLTEEEALKIAFNKYSNLQGVRFEEPILDSNDEKLLSHAKNLWDRKLEFFDGKGTFTPESYIKALNFTPKLSEDQLSTLFNQTFFYINTHENSKKLKKYLSVALSDEEGSLDWFELLILKVMSENFYINLEKMLKI